MRIYAHHFPGPAREWRARCALYSLAAALTEIRTPQMFHLQPGYDHSYFFVASFIEDHGGWHAERLVG